MSRAAAMKCLGVPTTLGYIYLTDAQEGAMRLGFANGREYQFEMNVCTRSVSLKLEEKGLIKRYAGRYVGLRVTDIGKEVVSALKSMGRL